MWLLAMMCHWLAFGPFNYGFTLLLEEQGLPPRMAGWFWTMGISAEIAVFFASGWFFRRWGYRTLLFFAMACNLLRWGMIGLYPRPWVIALSQILHGPGFALFYAAAIQGIHIYCKGMDRASYQGLFSTCVGGISAIMGSVAAGWLHDRMPFKDVLLWCLPVQGLAMLLLALFPLHKHAKRTP